MLKSEEDAGADLGGGGGDLFLSGRLPLPQEFDPCRPKRSLI